MSSREQIYAFLVALFGDDLDGKWLLVWTNPGKKSVWFTSIEDAAIYASTLSGVNVYFGICLSPVNAGPDARCPAAKVVTMPGLWADIDIAHGAAHAKANLPADLAAAKALVAALPVQPTITVHSGHGLQCYWLFREPWDIDNDVERAEAAALARGWHEVVAAQGARMGYSVDATWDLARVFRLPGSFNVKDPSDPKQVLVIEEYDERRYNPEDFPEYFPEDLSAYSVEMERDKSYLAVTLTRKPVVDNNMLEDMFDFEPRAKATWIHRRKDLVDQSMSSYDMSLAAYAVQCGWTDQQIADLIVSFRLKHGSEQDIKKAFRLDYISRTIKNARIKFGRAEAEADADKVLELTNTRIMEEALAANAPKEEPKVSQKQQDAQEGPKTPRERPKEQKPAQVSAGDKKALIEAISAKLGLPIRRVLKYLADPPVYALDTALGEIQIGNIRNLIRLGNLQTAVAEAVGVMLPSKIKGWDQVAQALLRAVEEVDCGEDATASGRVRYWLESYFDGNRISEDWENAWKGKVPFRKEGHLYIFLHSLRDHLAKDGDKLSAKDISYDLKRFGCMPHTMGFTIHGLKTTRAVFEVPAHFDHGGRQSDNPMDDALED